MLQNFFLLANIPFSNVTVIALVLGVFFLLVAFYKQIFHRRNPPGDTSPQLPEKKDEDIVKLADPFQQAPVPPQPVQAEKPAEPVQEVKLPPHTPEKSVFHLYSPHPMFGKEDNEEQHGNQKYIWQ